MREADGSCRFELDGITAKGRTHAIQLVYFLERANEELQRATLEKRSFVPDMVRSVDDAGL